MTNKLNLELKVGIFAFIALIILTLAVFSISDIYIFHPGYNIKVYFNFASGIDIGAPVRVAGVGAGEVKDIQMSYDAQEGKLKVILLVWLKEGVKVPSDSRAFVSVLGLLGETYLEIIPGQDYAHILRDGDVLAGRNPLSSDTLMEVVHKVAADFDNVLNSTNEILDEQTKEDLKETIHNFHEFSASLKVITGRLERGEGKLGAWLKPRQTPKAQGKPK